MNRVVSTIASSGASALAALGFSASACEAPARVGSAQDALDTMVRDGYKVILIKLGTGRLDLCTVHSVRPGETVYRTVRTGERNDHPIAYQTVYLTANC
jgi:DNA-binding GntR family transcriptional regulator